MNRTFMRKIYDRLMTLVLCLFALLLVAVIGVVAVYLIRNGAEALSWEFISEPPKDGMLAGGILTPLVGTMQLVLVSMGVALPVGIMTGLYFAEYAKDTWIVRLMRISIRSLAGVPSVIFGLFGLSLFVVFMQFGSCLLSAGLTLACSRGAAGLPRRLLRARRDEVPDDNQGRAAIGGFDDNHGRHPCGGPRRRRDGANNVHGCRLLRAGDCQKRLQPGYGAAVPHICSRHLGDGPRGGGPDRVRGDTGTHRTCNGNERGGSDSARPSRGKERKIDGLHIGEQRKV